MSTTIVIHWIERGSDLLEARVVLPDGRDIYAGYIAASPGHGVWRGYVGADFSPVGMGPRTEMQAAVEQRVVEIIQRAGTQEGTGHNDRVRPTIVMVSALGLRLRSPGSVTPTAVGGQPGRGALSAPRSGAAVPVRCHATAVAGSISQS